MSSVIIVKKPIENLTTTNVIASFNLDEAAEKYKISTILVGYKGYNGCSKKEFVVNELSKFIVLKNCDSEEELEKILFDLSGEATLYDYLTQIDGNGYIDCDSCAYYGVEISIFRDANDELSITYSECNDRYPLESTIEKAINLIESQRGNQAFFTLY